MRWLLARLTGTRGFRAAARRVAEDPSAANYLALARESVQRGEPGRVEDVCREALALHPGHAGLKTILARATRMRLDERARRLQRELADAPRPALWRELVEIELELDQARQSGSLGGQPSFASALEAASRGGVVSPVGCDAPQEAEVEETSLASVRPGLQALVACGEGLCASYHRGGTALVQGMTGATADRTARGVRDLTRAARTGVRRLGLGPLRGVRVIGEHGDLAIRSGGVAAAAAIGPGELPAAALESLETLAHWEARP